MKESNKNDKYMLQSVTNALRIIELLAEQGEMNTSAVGEALEIGKSTAFRLLTTLEIRNFVVKSKSNQYSLGTKFTYFGSMVLSRLDIIHRARPYLEKLSILTDSDTHLVIRDEDYSVRFIDKVSAKSSIAVDSYVGMPRKSYVTASGKILLAYLPEAEMDNYLSTETFTPQTPFTVVEPNALKSILMDIRKDGVCVSKDEDELGFTCIAAPILDRDGQAIASISISGTNTAINSNGNHYKEMVIDAANKISMAL